MLVKEDLPCIDASILIRVDIGLRNNLVDIDVKGHLGTAGSNPDRALHVINSVRAHQEGEYSLNLASVNGVGVVFGVVTQDLDNLLVGLVRERVSSVQILAVGKQPFLAPAAVRLSFLLPQAYDGFSAHDEFHAGTGCLVRTQGLRQPLQHLIPVIHRADLCNAAVVAKGVFQFLVSISICIQVRRTFQLHNGCRRRVLQFVIALDIAQSSPAAHQEQNLLLQRTGFDGKTLQLMAEVVLFQRLH